jgi:hypothetical protein
MVRFGFIGLPPSVEEIDSSNRRVSDRQKSTEGISQYEECQSELHAIGKEADCKVPPMPMVLSSH